jgi:hypothetical protein
MKGKDKISNTERINRLDDKELCSYLKFRRIIIMIDEYISYAILLFILWNISKYGIFVVLLVILLIFVGVYLRGYKKYWKLSNKYLVKEG